MRKKSAKKKKAGKQTTDKRRVVKKIVKKAAKKSHPTKAMGQPSSAGVAPTASPVPAGFSTVSAYLNVRGGARAIEFYKKAFGAKEKGRITMKAGGLGHAEIQIGDSTVMLADEDPAWGNKSPESLGGTPVTMALYVPDVDAVFMRAVLAGAAPERAVADQFYGDRTGTILDPFGHRWTIATRKETISFQEMQKRADDTHGAQK